MQAMRKRPTAADRPQFRRDVLGLMEKLDVHVGEPDEATVILCTRADDFDPASNVLWEREDNQSAVRPGIVCSTCKQTVALSNHAHGRYLALDKKPRICCTRCLPSFLAEKP
jgi:hypothetical protein